MVTASIAPQQFSATLIYEHPGTTHRIHHPGYCEYIASDSHIEYDQAMNLFYNSAVFGKLQDVETGLFLESSAYVYDLFRDERQFGRIVQREQ